MRAVEVEKLARSLEARLRGGFLGKVFRPDPWTLGFEMQDGGTLGFCWEPACLAVGLCAWRWPRGAPEEILVRHLQSALVDGVTSVPGEPILRIALSGGTARAFVWEGIGRSANALLLGEGDLILWSGRLLKGPMRSGRTGERWNPPPVRAGVEAEPARETGDAILQAGADRLLSGLVERGRRTALAKLDQRAKALARKVEALEGDRGEGAAWLALEPLAQALLATGDLNRRGETSRRVWDYTRDPPAEADLELDPAKTVRENASDLFKKVQRGKARMALVEEHLTAARRELELLPARRSDLEACSDLALLYPGGKRVTRATPAQARRTLPPGVASVALPKGYTGYAGKSAEGNDTVSFKLGRGADVWFHASDYAGCHVVVRCPPKTEDLPYDVEQAAALYAAAHSGAPPGNRVAVVVSRCKYLRRVKGAPGRVMMSSHRTVFVDLPRGR
jgi:predicted ribosome quality control (RQC) complex YloA/Tae2 family protein